MAILPSFPCNGPNVAEVFNCMGWCKVYASLSHNEVIEGNKAGYAHSLDDSIYPKDAELLLVVTSGF